LIATLIFSTHIAQMSLNYCYLKRKPATTPKQSCTLPAELHIAFVELRWLAAGLQGQLINCHHY
jgi:hypothetical protein